MGMTRAWLMAGAGAVIATKWPTPDDVGVFFQRFYRELQRSEFYDPAGALRAAQIEAIRSGDWRSQPGSGPPTSQWGTIKRNVAKLEPE